MGQIVNTVNVPLLNILSLTDRSQLLLNLGTILWVLWSGLWLSELWIVLSAHVGLAVPSPCPVPAPRPRRFPVFVCTPLVIVQLASFPVPKQKPGAHLPIPPRGIARCVEALSGRAPIILSASMGVSCRHKLLVSFQTLFRPPVMPITSSIGLGDPSRRIMLEGAGHRDTCSGGRRDLTSSQKDFNTRRFHQTVAAFLQLFNPCLQLSAKLPKCSCPLSSVNGSGIASKKNPSHRRTGTGALSLFWPSCLRTSSCSRSLNWRLLRFDGCSSSHSMTRRFSGMTRSCTG